jgi:predicted polyphosphate/ATP-dependent NAD kinase
MWSELITLGLVVNPIAGMGGRVGLKGTDGVAQEALKRGAKPVSPERTKEFLNALKRNFQDSLSFPQIITCAGMMGQEETNISNIKPSQILQIPPVNTSVNQGTLNTQVSQHLLETEARHTKMAIREFIGHEVDLIVFVGGDGTARDVLDVLNEYKRGGTTKASKAKHSIANPDADLLPPVLGVPSGVKMYSAVFALNPADAAEIVSLFSQGKAEVDELEVLDIDEDAFRNDRLSVRLYGYMKCLYVPMRSQASKEISLDLSDEKENQEAIARTIIEMMDPDAIYLLGPGTTVKSLADLLKVKKTLLGVDIYHKGKILVADASEETILRELGRHGGGKNAWIVVSPIGRQGMIFGRGNQQISSKVIKAIGKDHIIVLATRVKIQNIDGGALKVDTGDKDVDNMLRGYSKVLTDYREWRMLQVL